MARKFRDPRTSQPNAYVLPLDDEIEQSTDGFLNGFLQIPDTVNFIKKSALYNEKEYKWSEYRGIPYAKAERFEYSSQGSSWKVITTANLPIPLADSGAASINNKVYLFPDL